MLSSTARLHRSRCYLLSDALFLPFRFWVPLWVIMMFGQMGISRALYYGAVITLLVVVLFQWEKETDGR